VAEIVRKGIRTFFIFGLFFLFFGQISLSEAVVERVVAVVNQDIITLSEVERVVGHLKEGIESENRLQRRERMNELFRKALDTLIEEKLIDQEVKRSGVKVTSKEVDGTIEEIKRRNGASQEDLEKALSKDGLTLEAFKKEVEKKLLRTKLVNWAVKVDPKAGEKELRDFYQKNIDQYRIELSYRPSHILFVVPKEAKSEEVRAIRGRCQNVLERIKAGEDFGEMAILYSEDTSSKDKGDLGYFKKGELLPAIEKEAVRLKIGEVGGIVRTEFGFHIIKLLDRRGGESSSFEEVRQKIQADYFEKEFEKAFSQFIGTLKEKSVIEIKL
jgi:peptidyl-prolyl cis-trans isomerase SurA